MKKTIIIAAIALLSCGSLSAQSTNALNYSGKMYVSDIEVISTPRYISYEDHAILSTDHRVPMVEVTPATFDFGKGIISLSTGDLKVKVTSVKKYTSEWEGWTVVIYCDTVPLTDKLEVVWKEYGNPYVLQISRNDEGCSIAKMNLSSKPVAVDPNEALMMLLGL